MDDFDIAQSKIGESAQRVVDRAVEESRRRDHALTASDEPGIRQRAFELGASAFIAKRVLADQLVHAIQQLMDGC